MKKKDSEDENNIFSKDIKSINEQYKTLGLGTNAFKNIKSINEQYKTLGLGTNAFKNINSINEQYKTLGFAGNLLRDRNSIGKLPNKIQKLEERLSSIHKTLRLRENLQKEEKEKLEKEHKELQDKIEFYKLKLKLKEEEIQKLKSQLSTNILEAKSSLEKALKNTDQRIAENKEQSIKLRNLARYIFYTAIGLVFIIPITVLNPFNWEWLHIGTYNFSQLVNSLKQWGFIFYTFPIIVFVVIGTTLLRHDKKLIDEIRHFSNMKHEIELYSGLLEASQHAANSFGDPEKAAEYVEETFTLIRNKLLKAGADLKLDTNNNSDNDIDNEKAINVIDKLVNLLTKAKNL